MTFCGHSTTNLMKKILYLIAIVALISSCNFVESYEVTAEAETYGKVYRKFEATYSGKVAAYKMYGYVRDSMDELKYVTLVEKSTKGHVDTVMYYIPGYDKAD